MIANSNYKYSVAAIFAVALVMDLLDMTMLNVALPALAARFGASPATVSWVVTGYLLAIAVAIPIGGWACDRFGTKTSFLVALITFTFASGMCSQAWSIETLILFRALQGLGGGLLSTTGMTLVFHAFPQSERSRATTIVSLPALVAPASGPLLGGYLVQEHGWKWIFLVNVPIGAAAVLASVLVMRNEKQDATERLDVAGLVLSSIGLGSVTYALSVAGFLGVTAVPVMASGALGILSLGAFVFVELRTARPLIDLRLFRQRIFTTLNIIQFLIQSSVVGTTFLIPLILQDELRMSPEQSGLTTFPSAIGIVLTVPIAAKIYPRLGPRALLLGGLSAFAASTLPLMMIDSSTSQNVVRLIMLLRGMAFGVIHVPLQTATFATISKSETSRASAVFNGCRQVAASFGVALVATVLTTALAHAHATLGDLATRDAAMVAFRECFAVSTLVAALGIGVAFLVRNEDAASTMRQPAAVEEAAPAA